MAIRSTIIILLLTLLLALVSKSSAGFATFDGHHIQRTLSASDGSGLVGDFVDPDEELGMDSESTRRSLRGSRRYISYGALSKDKVPCNRRGASYYNCNSRTRVNPYRRGCSAITRCARNLK